MDAHFFLKQRTDFIRFYYDHGAIGFAQARRAIEAAQPPYDRPSYGEDDEPAFLQEWMDCESAIEVLGLSCISLLSDSLKLYFQTLQKRVIGFSFARDKDAFKLGFVAAYLGALRDISETDGADCPADLAIIEQIVLARNRGQHGEDLTSFGITHDRKTLEKHAIPFFATEDERHTWDATGESLASFLLPSITVTREHLFAALDQVELLADWIESQMGKVWEWRSRRK